MSVTSKWLGTAFGSIALTLAACGSHSSPGVLHIEPGAEGTVMAVGADTSMTVTEKGEAGFEFKLQPSNTSGMSIGTATGNASSGKNDGMLFVPASITKVVTSALILKHLGDRYRFQTEIVWDEDEPGVARDAVIFADGDPQVSKVKLDEIVKLLKAKGVRKFVGGFRLVASDERRNQANPPEGLDAEDLVNCYGSRVQAFNFGRNCASVTILNAEKATWSDKGIGTELKTVFQTGSSRSVRVLLNYDQFNSVLSYTFQGVWPAGAKPVSFALPVPDARVWYGNLLLRNLGSAGIDILDAKPQIPQGIETDILRAGRGNHSRRVSVYSNPMSQILVEMNKPSDNFLADALFRAFAVKGLSLDLREAGIDVINSGVEEWMARAGHPEYASEIKLVDGAGLSRANRVSPRAFLTLLKEFSREPSFPVLWNSLSIAGVDGTLRGRMKGTAAEGFVRGKTGTLRGAYQLVGYVPRKSHNDYVPFVILSAASPSNRAQVRAFQNKLTAQLAAQIKAGK